ncbi:MULTISPECIES: DUF6236 family protein [Aeromonas]|uniref:DUF6236 family protein n=1 Tax=Aeromonas TaxID=642 RepID=UPI001FB89DCD|nr:MULTISPECIES: DUF6236 family protein [Aeromonas]GKR03721.1 hypothetical protein KAM462_34410 [Aeromonas caviae]GKR12296.1 hypothetical protein KAM465_38730 [Aeromonas caviae]GKR16572.1 hypothetical protein KAM466_38900 [Aeromonas caviae]GKR20890.1 hypothetical protein KAM467_39340 [Aeromonas caviae]GKR25445.1 hypothetical protein KAM468_41850 [Aeromonas caviae]
MNKKGIVISPPFEPILTGGIRCGGDPDPLELRKYILYWDQIDYPTNNLIHVSSHDIDYLESTGVLKRTRVIFQGEVNTGRGEFLIAAQEAALAENQQKEPGVWTIAQLSQKPFYTKSFATTGIEFELYDVLPIPAVDTPFDEILEFKRKRSDELSAFRCYIDEIIENIIASKDIPRAKNVQVARLELAIKDIDRVLNESTFKRTTGNLRSVINSDFSGIVGAGLGAAGIASLIPMPPLIAGVATAGLVITAKTLMMPATQCPTDLNYIQSVKSSF